MTSKIFRDKIVIVLKQETYDIINIFSGFKGHALVAQLDRVFGYEPKGQGFESLRAHHSGNGSTW